MSCECETPKPWANRKGETTNRCETCGGVIANPSDRRTEGSLIISVQKALRDLPVHSQDELDRFVDYMAQTVSEKFRSAFLTWRGNRAERTKSK